MLNKKDLIFYIIVGNVIALIAVVAGASLPVILFLSLLVPPLLLLIIRIIGSDTREQQGLILYG